LAAAVSAFCSSDGGGNDLDGVTLEQLRTEMLAAMYPSAGVMHTHERFEEVGETQVVTQEQDVWRSAATAEARIEAGAAAPVIFADGARHSLDAAGVVQTLDYGRLEQNYALLGSAGILFSETADGSRLERATIDGVAAILIEVSLPTDDGTSDAKVYLAESDKLPIRVEYPNFIAEYEHEIIARDSLAADFFSPESLESTSETGE
jgi:hypothetical protein